MKEPSLTVDIVIPTHKKDLQILEYCIDAAKRKIVGAGRIIVISAEKYSNNAEWFDEKLFPFSIELVRESVGESAGWYFQQLLKLYAPLIIPNISENVLILDSDTVFFRRVKMLDENGRAFCTISKDENAERHDFDQRVAEHTERMLSSLATKNLPREFQGISGINHNMIFNREILRDLFNKVAAQHNGEPFYKVFLKFSQQLHSASEYQIYFCFLLIYHRDKIRIRKLCYKNTSDINIRKYQKRFKYHYCSFHSYLRGTRSNSIRVKSGKFFKDFFYKYCCLESNNIGIARCNIGKFLDFPNQEIKWLQHQKINSFPANPFGFGDRIFFERKTHFSNQAEICNLQLDSQLKIIDEKIVLKGSELSCIFHDNDQRFALVRNGKTRKFIIYQINNDGGFEKIADLLNDAEIFNPTIEHHEGKWWLFFAKSLEENNQLHIAFSDDLQGEWQMHPQNPISLEESQGHSAGEIFSYHDALFRPSQNRAQTREQSIVVNRIFTLTEENYTERKEIELFPNQLGQYPDGICSIASFDEDLTLLSGKKFSLAPHKPLILLVRWLSAWVGRS